MKNIERGLVFDAAVSPAHERCSAFTSLIHLAAGGLICGFKCGPQKLCSTDRQILMKSEDEGKTWYRLFDAFDTNFEGTPGSFSGGYLVEPEPGRLLISLHWIDRTDPNLPLSNPVTSGVLPMKYLTAQSTDAGLSWSIPQEVNLSPHPGANPTGPIIKLSNDQLMLAYESWKEWDAVEGNQSANVKLSEDGGMTWSEPITMASDPRKQFYYWDNRLARQPDTGRLLAGLWTHEAPRGIDAPIHLVWGEPNGRHWCTPHPTPIQGQVATPLFLDRHRLLLVYVHRHDPPSIRAVLSEDEGQTWDTDHEIIIHDCGRSLQSGMGQSRSDAEYWDDMTRWTFGHPSITLLDDQSVLVVYYAPSKHGADMYSNTEVLQDPLDLSIHWTRLK